MVLGSTWCFCAKNYLVLIKGTIKQSKLTQYQSSESWLWGLEESKLVDDVYFMVSTQMVVTCPTRDKAGHCESSSQAVQSYW